MACYCKDCIGNKGHKCGSRRPGAQFEGKMPLFVESRGDLPCSIGLRKPHMTE